ncbi:MAG: aldo/keto reductase [Bacteroidales bacterium]|nr:aldo/keto reductase [Bacteroidales bacterium]
MKDNSNTYSRKEFIKTTLAGLAAGALMIPHIQCSTEEGIPLRSLGNSGIRIPILGLGGWTIGRKSVAEKDGITIMHEAIDEGLRFFDNCWEYNGGVSEERMGKALSESWRRDKVFLMTKTCGRMAADATKQLEESLTRLKTDRIDLWMFHGIKRNRDRDLIFGEGGAMEAALKAKKEGKVRYIGFSGHEHPDHFLNMLDENFNWDAVLLPLNAFDYHYRSFQKNVLPVLNDKNIGVLGMKALLAGRLPKMEGFDPKLARKYVLSLPITSLLCGIETREQLHQDLSVARNFKPMNEDEVKQWLAMAEEIGITGEHEGYKKGNSGCDWHYKQHEGFKK